MNMHLHKATVQDAPPDVVKNSRRPLWEVKCTCGFRDPVNLNHYHISRREAQSVANFHRRTAHEVEA